jgi:hypothetical protein
VVRASDSLASGIENFSGKTFGGKTKLIITSINARNIHFFIIFFILWDSSNRIKQVAFLL